MKTLTILPGEAGWLHLFSIANAVSAPFSFCGSRRNCLLYCWWLSYQLFLFFISFPFSHFSFSKNTPRQLKQQQEYHESYRRNHQSSAWLLPISSSAPSWFPQMFTLRDIQKMKNGAGQEKRKLTFVKLLICVSGTQLDTFTYKVSVEIFCVNRTHFW